VKYGQTFFHDSKSSKKKNIFVYTYKCTRTNLSSCVIKSYYYYEFFGGEKNVSTLNDPRETYSTWFSAYRLHTIYYIVFNKRAFILFRIIQSHAVYGLEKGRFRHGVILPIGPEMTHLFCTKKKMMFFLFVNSQRRVEYVVFTMTTTTCVCVRARLLFLWYVNAFSSLFAYGRSVWKVSCVCDPSIVCGELDPDGTLKGSFSAFPSNFPEGFANNHGSVDPEENRIANNNAFR